MELLAAPELRYGPFQFRANVNERIEHRTATVHHVHDALCPARRGPQPEEICRSDVSGIEAILGEIAAARADSDDRKVGLPRSG